MLYQTRRLPRSSALPVAYASDRPGTVALLRSPGIALREHRYRDDLVSRARRAPAAVEHDAEQRPLVRAAERDAVQPLRPGDRAEKLAVGREDVHRRSGADVEPPFGVH